MGNLRRGPIELQPVAAIPVVPNPVRLKPIEPVPVGLQGALVPEEPESQVQPEPPPVAPDAGAAPASGPSASATQE